MSDTSGGPGWWQASDDRWYPPETHPDYRVPAPQQPTPGLSQFGPPNADERYPIQPATSLGAPGDHAVPTAVGGSVPPRQDGGGRRSTGKVLAVIFGLTFLLLAGGCGLFVYNFRDQIADAAVDFTDAESVDVDASCEVVGTGFGDSYGVDATLVAHSDEQESHYEMTFELFASDGELLGEDRTVFRALAPGQERTEDAFNTIVISAEAETVRCEVTGVRRVSA